MFNFSSILYLKKPIGFKVCWKLSGWTYLGVQWPLWGNCWLFRKCGVRSLIRFLWCDLRCTVIIGLSANLWRTWILFSYQNNYSFTSYMRISKSTWNILWETLVMEILSVKKEKEKASCIWVWGQKFFFFFLIFLFWKGTFLMKT